MTARPFRFAHMADIHLGAVRFDVPALARDCLDAFRAALRLAREREVDFIVLAGDVFHRSLVPPEVLRDADEALEEAGGVPVLAIDGNHDTPLYTERPSYLWYLGQRGRLVFLRPFFDRETQSYQPVPWDAERGEGFYHEPLEGVRVYGLGYGGATAGVRVARMASVMESGSRATLALFHGAIDRLVGTGLGEIRYEELDPLRPLVDYLACGHIHKRYDDGWAHNPGSLENIYLDEAERDARGFFVVDADEGGFRAELVEVPGRPVFRPAAFDAAGAADPAALEQAFTEWVDGLECDPEAIVEVRLTGAVPFNFALVDLDRLRARVGERLAATHVVLHNDLNLVGRAGAVGGFMDREAIEREVLEEVLAENLPDYTERSDELLGLIETIRRRDPSKDPELLDILEMARQLVVSRPEDEA